MASNMDLLLDLQEQLIHLRDDALAMEQRHAADIQCCKPEWQPSARNLLHYLSCVLPLP